MDRRGPLALAAWLAGLGAGLWGFHTTVDPRLAAPPLAPADLQDWLAVTDPAVAVMALTRLLVLCLGWYLLGVSLVGLVARVARMRRLVVLTELLSVPVVRRLVRSAVGTGLAATMVVAPSPARALPLPLEILAPAQGAADGGNALPTSSPTPTPAQGGDPALPLPLGLLHTEASTDVPPSADAATDDPPSPGENPPASAAHPPAGEVHEEHVVRPGESFWSIARDQLAADGRPTDAQVVALWNRMIEDNRDRLVDPDNPDLLFPGQSLTVPSRP